MAEEFFDPNPLRRELQYFPSQGRGQFVLSQKPKVFDDTRLNLSQKEKLQDGYKILEGGLFASQFTIPTFSLGTFEAFSYVGPTKRIAYGQQFQDFDVTFILAGRTQEKAQTLYYTFAMWQKLIGGPDIFSYDRIDSIITGFSAPRMVSDSNGFSAAYYDNYISTAEMIIYAPVAKNTSGTIGRFIQDVFKTNIPFSDPIIQVTFTEIYPISINPLQLSWENPDTPLNLSVTFAYHYADVAMVPKQKPIGSP